MKALVSVIARTPGALDVIMPGELDAVLQRLQVMDPEARAAAAIASYDDPSQALARAARVSDILGSLTESERLFVDTAYEETLSNRLFFNDPERLAEVLGAPPAVSSGDDLPPIPALAVPKYGLFPHQRRAVVTAQRLLAPSDTRVLMHMPTGAGKTRSAMNIVCDFLRGRPKGVVIWAASTKELLEQAAREFASAWTHLGNRKVTIGQGWSGGANAPVDIEDGFLAITLQSLHALLQRNPVGFDELADRCELMVFDEAHQAIARTWSTVTERIADRGRLLGLSATPGRTALGHDKTDQDLAAFFGKSKVTLKTDQEGHANPVRYLVDHGYLAETTFQTVHLDVPAGIATDPHEYDLPTDEYTEQVVRLIVEHAPKDHRVMVFAASVAHARTVAAASTGCGVPARYVIGAMGQRARHRAIDWFKQPDDSPKVIVNYGVLATGFDAPDVAAAIIARPTNSLVLYSQMVGRAIRGPEAGGTQKALVLTVVDHDNPAFSNIAEAFENWEMLWEDATNE